MKMAFNCFVNHATRRKQKKNKEKDMRVSIPLLNEDGSLKTEISLNEKEVQALLQFGLNMATAMGIAQQYMPDEDETVQ